MNILLTLNEFFVLLSSPSSRRLALYLGLSNFLGFLGRLSGGLSLEDLLRWGTNTFSS